MEDSDQLQFDPRELEKLTPADSREIQQFLQNENQKTQVQRCKLKLRYCPIDAE